MSEEKVRKIPFCKIHNLPIGLYGKCAKCYFDSMKTVTAQTTVEELMEIVDDETPECEQCGFPKFYEPDVDRWVCQFGCEEE